MLQDNSNIVNKMYVHELNIKWSHFQELASSETEVSNEKLIAALNEFRKALTTRKYQYNYKTKNGFRADSPLFSAKYLDDAINILIKRQIILENKGINWGYGRFNVESKFSPKSFPEINKSSMFMTKVSDLTLMLSQQIDFQYRITGKRIFYKYNLVLPLLIFHTTKNITENKLINIESQAKKAKNTFEKAKIIVVAECLDKNFTPVIENSPIDAIFILQKSFSGHYDDLKTEVFDTLEQRISEYINEKKTDIERYLEKGIIE